TAISKALSTQQAKRTKRLCRRSEEIFVAKSDFRYLVERCPFDHDGGFAVPQSLVEESVFVFQRAESGAASPDFTYVGLEVEIISRERADSLCFGDDDSDGFA